MTHPEMYGLPRVATFVYDGVSWTAPILFGRLIWVGAALVLAGGTSLFFDRFDPARERLRVPQKGGQAHKQVSSQRVPPPTGGSLPAPATLPSLRATGRARWPTPLTRTVLSELRLMVRRSGWWWYLAGLIFALATASGACVRLVMAGQWSALLALSVGAVFIPALALALGVWSRGSKLFEVVYLVLWYVGPMNGNLALDYLGATDAAVAGGMPLVYALLTVLLLGLAVLGSRLHLRS